MAALSRLPLLAKEYDIQIPHVGFVAAIAFGAIGIIAIVFVIRGRR
jgi:hypothetical protein